MYSIIDSREKYLFFLEQDKNSLGITKHRWFGIFNYFNVDSEIWKFQKILRKYEYLINLDNKSIFWKINKHITAYRFKKISIKLGFTIMPNCFGPGLRIVHRGPIVVNGGCKIGSNCSINIDVVIGVNEFKNHKVPILGNNIFIGPGAKIYGDIFIQDGCVIGTNSVVNKSFFNKNKLLVGIPAIEKCELAPSFKN